VGVLQRFERRLEELVNRPFAKAFKSEVEPVEIASALQRECDDRAAIVARGRTMVPNEFTVELGPSDHDRLSGYADPLSGELAAMVREHAQEQGYSFIGPVEIGFEQVDDLETGRFRIRSAAVAGATPSGPPPTQRVGASTPSLEVGGTSYPLGRPVTTIGRGSDADLRIDDPGISRRHAEIRVQGDRAVLVDLGSTNGSVVDGQQVQQAELRDGSRVVLGSTTVVFHTGGR
jgi:FHA domain-containing protein